MGTLGSIVVPLVFAALIGFAVGWFFARSGSGNDEVGSGSSGVGDKAGKARSAPRAGSSMSAAEASTFERRVAQLEADYDQRSEAFATREAELTAAGRKVVEQLRLRERELAVARGDSTQHEAQPVDATASEAGYEPVEPSPAEATVMPEGGPATAETSLVDETVMPEAGPATAETSLVDETVMPEAGPATAETPSGADPAAEQSGPATAESLTLAAEPQPEPADPNLDGPQPVEGRSRRRAVIDPVTGLPIGAAEPVSATSVINAIDDAPEASEQSDVEDLDGQEASGEMLADDNPGVEPSTGGGYGADVEVGSRGDADVGGAPVDDPIEVHDLTDRPAAEPEAREIDLREVEPQASAHPVSGSQISVRLVAPRPVSEEIQVIDLRQRRLDREESRQAAQSNQGQGEHGQVNMALAGGGGSAEATMMPSSPSPSPSPSSTVTSTLVVGSGTVAVPPPNPDLDKADAVDDLTRIVGIGPKMASELAEAGVGTFAELAGLDPRGALPASLEPLRGRMRRDEWVEQASSLA